MKSRATVSLFALTLFFALAVTSVHAQRSERLVVDVPFAFTIGDTQFSAGEYSVTKANESSTVLMIRDGNGRNGIMFTTNPGNGKAGRTEQAKMVFNKYGDQYFLSSVHRPGGIVRTLKQSRRERNVEKEMAAINRAATPQSVAVLVRRQGL